MVLLIYSLENQHAHNFDQTRADHVFSSSVENGNQRDQHSGWRLIVSAFPQHAPRSVIHTIHTQLSFPHHRGQEGKFSTFLRNAFFLAFPFFLFPLSRDFYCRFPWPTNKRDICVKESHLQQQKKIKRIFVSHFSSPCCDGKNHDSGAPHTRRTSFTDATFAYFERSTSLVTKKKKDNIKHEVQFFSLI